MTTRFTRLDALVPFARLRAQRGIYDGRMSPTTIALMRACSHVWAYSPAEYAQLLYTRDVGHHTGGWWKNPDYERCWHLSVSYRATLTGEFLEHDRDRSHVIAASFFGSDVGLAWIEGPYSPEGKAAQVWHYRVFADEGWQPLRPRGEVYSRDWTPAGWKSFSEIHGFKPASEQAPFLLAQGDGAE